MLNIPKAKLEIWATIMNNNFVSWVLILVIFCLLGNVFAQIPPVPGFPPGREFDPRHPRVLEEIRGQNARATAISENVEFVGTTEGAVYDVFVQGNYAYLCAGGFLAILDISAPDHPTKIGHIALPDIAYGVYVSGSHAYVADSYSGLRVIDVSSPENPTEVGFYDMPGYARGVYFSKNYVYVADKYSGLNLCSRYIWRIMCFEIYR